MAKTEATWSKSELKKIKKALPDGWQSALAGKHQLSAGTIENILYGAQQNDSVVLSAIELAEAHKAFIQSKKAVVKSL